MCWNWAKSKNNLIERSSSHPYVPAWFKEEEEEEHGHEGGHEEHGHEGGH